MSAVTSERNKIEIGEGKDKKTIFTGTKITPTRDKDGNKTYKVEIVQYDNEKGDGGRVIGEKKNGKINYNNKAGNDIKNDANAQKSINNASKTQAKSIENDLVTNNAESKAFHKANGNGNQGTEAENDQSAPTLTEVGDAKNIINGKAGKEADGTRSEGFGSYIFPEDLRKGAEGESGQDYLKFDMMKYQPRDFDKKSFSFTERTTEGRSIGHVILPIPGGIQDAQSVQWGGQTMTPLDMAKANAALTGVTKGIGEMVSEIGGAAQNLGGAFDDNSDALAAVIAGMAAGGQQLLTRTTGAITNPNMELLFGGPQLRTFSFQFLLAPRNDKESKEVIRIIRFFKQGMSPIRTKARLFMKSPHTFKLSYKNSTGKEHKYLNKFKECALGSFGVNYAPNGNYSTFEDGAMTAYQVSMTFREINPIYNDDYGDGDEFTTQTPAIGF